MKVQYISFSGEINDNLSELGRVTNTKLSNPQGFEPFDITIIDISDEWIWRSEHSSKGTINCTPDLRSLGTLIKNDESNLVIIIIPLNCSYFYFPSRERNKYNNKLPLKNDLTTINKIIKDLTITSLELEYAAYKHDNINMEAKSDFYITNTLEFETVYTPNNPDRSMLSKIQNSRIYITTINGLNSEGIQKLMSIAGEIAPPAEEPPDWFSEITMFDDVEQNKTILKQGQIIESAKSTIRKANEKLDENSWLKSVLFKKDQELVEVVKDILERLFDLNLSEFEDKKKEDLLFTVDEITYVVEIKGTTSNVRRDHVSQLEHHVQNYIEQNNVTEKEVKGLLIINPMRTTCPKDRHEVHEHQINLAARYGSLIILTETLLQLLSDKYDKKLNRDQLLQELSKTGLLNY